MKKTTIPPNAKRVPLRPLALGETSGHAHRLVTDGNVALEDACEMYVIEGEPGAFLRVTTEGVSLIHAEMSSIDTADHHPHALVPGDYAVVIQQEETDWGTRDVID